MQAKLQNMVLFANLIEQQGVKILLLHHFFCPPGGYGNNRSYELAKVWAEEGNEIFAITSSAYFPSGIYPVNEWFTLHKNLRVYAFPSEYRQDYNPLYKAFLYKNFARKLKRFSLSFSPDLVYAIAPPLEVLFAGKYLAERRNIPFYAELMDLWPEVPYEMKIIPRFLYEFYRKKMLKLYRKTEKIFLLSPDYLRLFKERYSSVKEKGILSYNGTNPEVFYPNSEKDYSRLRMIYAGALGKANDFLSVLQTVNTRKNELGDFLLDIYGWGKDLPKARSYVAEKGLSKQVRFFPPLPKEELAKKMREYNVGISSFAKYPVLQANSANKFYDYLASGLTVLLNYEGWQAEFLREYQAGFSAPQGDFSRFVNNLLILQKHPEILEKTSQNAVNLAKKHFDRKQIAKNVLFNLLRK